MGVEVGQHRFDLEGKGNRVVLPDGYIDFVYADGDDLHCEARHCDPKGNLEYTVKQTLNEQKQVIKSEFFDPKGRLYKTVTPETAEDGQSRFEIRKKTEDGTEQISHHEHPSVPNPDGSDQPPHIEFE